MQVPGVVTSLTSTIWGFASQASVAVGGVNTGVFEQSIVALAPATLITGGGISRTRKFWLQVLEQPLFVVVSVKVKSWLHAPPAFTTTLWVEVDPTMVPLPLIDHE